MESHTVILQLPDRQVPWVIPDGVLLIDDRVEAYGKWYRVLGRSWPAKCKSLHVDVVEIAEGFEEEKDAPT
jgi:hypothetical protein